MEQCVTSLVEDIGINLDTEHIFKNKEQCKQDVILKCKSAQRIKLILEKFNHISQNNMVSEREDRLQELIHDIFTDNNYTNIQLLNDFNHIKFYHHADDINGKAFVNIFEYLTNDIDGICDPHKCNHIERHYKDRSKLQNESILCHNDKDFHNEYIIKLITRIHVYFIHSEHINQLNIAWNNDKFNEIAHEFKHNFIDFRSICQNLKEQNVLTQESELRNAFMEYKDDKNQFITDVIDAYYSVDDEKLPLDENNILIHHLQCDKQTRRKIYECILTTQVKQKDLNNHNLIKIAGIIINGLYPQIELAQFKQIAAKLNIDGNIFVRGTPEFRHSVKFAKEFKSINGYNKKYLADIYKKINTGKWVLTTPKIVVVEEKEVIAAPDCDDHKSHDEESKVDDSKQTQQRDIYDLGVRFYFWQSMKNHKHFINRNYPDLKQEMLQNQVIGFDIERWQYLANEAEVDLQTDEVKKIKANGFYTKIYNIQKGNVFSMEHICALKLYTDYTKECGLFCSILRSENATQIAEICNWAKLLSECVQCYGSQLNKGKYYRGVTKIFNFGMFATRFNLPTSTTDNFTKAALFSGGSGIVLTLKKYSEGGLKSGFFVCQQYDVFKFECSKLSAFPQERETLFYGGNTVLRIAAIHQWQAMSAMHGKWTNYAKYIGAMIVILRLIHGLSVREHTILSNDKQQLMMFELVNHIFCTFNSHKSMLQLPPYIDQLLQYHVSNEIIKLNFIEIKNKYEWMRSIFLKANNIINISNICKLFANSHVIIFMMPQNYILSYDECISFIKEDLIEISAMDIMITISFMWSAQMPPPNKSRINGYRQELSHIKWKRNFSTDSVSFECIGESVAVQKLIESKLNKQMRIAPPPITVAVHTNNFPITHRKINIAFQCILTVEGFVNEFQKHTNVIISQQAIDLIIYMYAAPIIIQMKYENATKHFFLCLLTDKWNSVQQKIFNKFHDSTIIWPVELYYEKGSGGAENAISPYNCNSELSNNKEKIFQIKSRICTGIIDKIDCVLCKYYLQFGRKDYINEEGIGKFKFFVEESGFDEDIDDELKGNVDDCAIVYFDLDEDDKNIFPLEEEIEDEDAKNAAIYRILNEIAKYGAIRKFKMELSIKICINLTQGELNKFTSKYRSQMSILQMGDGDLKWFFAVGLKEQFPF